MKRASVLLTITIVLTSIGGLLASKIRTPSIFYKKTAANGPCNVPTTLVWSTTSKGGILTPISTSPTTATTCGYIRITGSL